MTAACRRFGRSADRTRCPTAPARLSWHYRTNLIKLENAASYPGLEIIAKLVPFQRSHSLAAVLVTLLLIR